MSSLSPSPSGRGRGRDFLIMFSFITRLYGNKYLNSTVILALDTTVSLLASILTIILGELLHAGSPIDPSIRAWWMAGAFVFSLAFFAMLRTQRSIIRHTTLRSLARIVAAVFLKEAGLAVVFATLPASELNPRTTAVLVFDFLLTFVMLVGMRIIMIYAYNFARDFYSKDSSRWRILIYGTENNSVSLVTRLAASSRFRVIGFIVPGEKSHNMSLSGLSVYSFSNAHDIEMLKESTGAQAVIFASEEEARMEQEKLIKYCTGKKLKVLIAPAIDEVIDGKVMKQNIREIKIEDLLGRDEIKINIREIEDSFRGKTVMVTGAAGSIGSELCRQLAGFGIKQLVLFDNAETPMHNIRLELEERFPELDFVPIIGDVRLNARLDYAFRKWRPQVVFHAAAYKHVPLMEENPCEAVLVNAVGSRNVADKCIEYDVEKMVMVSTDKAVNPTNIMGCTKRLAEIYVQALGLAIEQGRHSGRTKFVTTRFGNVLGSNGSVIPRFREQIAKGGPVTVTHPDITRFFMTIPEACRLVMEAATMTDGNQIFVFDMGQSVKIAHLAKRMIELAGLVPGKDIEIAYTGLRPGEKLYEEVLSNTENTIPTDHNRIRIAKVREYDYNDALKVAEQLEDLSRAVEIPDMVRLMKRTVPEFKSKNSKFEELDKELEFLQD